VTDAYRTIRSAASARITRKRSRFIAHLMPVSSFDEVELLITRLRREHHDARHICFAYRIHAEPAPLSGYDDAGEPRGSAGPPILQQLERANLLNILAAVVRHFGGVKLGVGGLVRAYSDAVADAIDCAEISVRSLSVQVEIAFTPDLTSAVMSTLHRLNAKIDRIEYDALAHATVTVSPSRTGELTCALREATGGRARSEVKV